MASDRACVWWAAGVSSRTASVGTSIAPTARVSSVTSIRGASGRKVWIPYLTPPLRKATPSTSKTLASTEPTNADWTTATSPSRNANMDTKSSGRFPRLDCSRPVAPGPRYSPTCSIDWPTTAAKAAMARAEMMKRAMSLAPTAVARPAAAVKTMALTMARRCEVSRASRMRDMSATSADVTAAGQVTLYSVTSGAAPGGVAEWSRQGPAKPSTAVRFRSPPPASPRLDCRSEAIFGVPAPDR